MQRTARSRYTAAFRLAAIFALAICALSRTSAAEPAQPRIIADFSDTKSLRTSGEQAQATVVEQDDETLLEIKTDAGASWPGALIEPRAGAWDLRGFDLVLMDVRNPEDAPLRVLLSVNNPGADGANHCNTGAVTVPARGKATLDLPFGMWHGNPGHPLDQAKIVSLRVFLDRPEGAHRFFIDNVRAAQFDRSAMDKIFASESFRTMQPVFGRGINLGNALEAPREGEWGVTLEESYFTAIADAGFDSVRIPVRWSAHAADSKPYRIDEEFFERVDWAVRQALSRKLRPIVNMHHYGEIMDRPDAHRERFLALWKQIAEHYQDFPAALAFELLNEPQASLSADKWNALLAETIPVVRRTNPTRQIVVGPVNFNGIDELHLFELPADDRHLVVTVHYYSPYKFTHQGAPWLGDEARAWRGKQWTGARAEQQGVIHDFDRALKWASEHRRPLYLGEFGVYEQADVESRANWTRFVADEARKRKMGFAYWEFCSGFGAYDASGGRWIEPLKAALLHDE